MFQYLMFLSSSFFRGTFLYIGIVVWKIWWIWNQRIFFIVSKKVNFDLNPFNMLEHEINYIFYFCKSQEPSVLYGINFLGQNLTYIFLVCPIWLPLFSNFFNVMASFIINIHLVYSVRVRTNNRLVMSHLP